MQLAEQKEVSSTKLLEQQLSMFVQFSFIRVWALATYIWIYLTQPPPTKLESVAPKNLSMDEIIDAGSSSYYEAKVAVLAS